MTWLQRPETSPTSVELCRTRPASALYVPEKKPWSMVRKTEMLKGRIDLCLELEVADDAVLLVLRGAGVAKLEDHLAEEDTARVHVRHCDHVLCGAARRAR